MKKNIYLAEFLKTYLKRPRIFAPILGEASKLSKDSINRCTVRVIMQVKGKLRDVNWGGSLGRNGLRG